MPENYTPPDREWVVFESGVVETDAPEPPLSFFQNRQWAAVKAARDAAKSAGASSPYGFVDTDPTSLTNLSGAVLAAQVTGAAFSVEWTMADNSVCALDAEAMIEVGLAAVAHAQTVHATGQVLRAAIYAAETIEAVEAIVWSD